MEVINSRSRIVVSTRRICLSLVAILSLAASRASAITAQLQGQSFGNTNWSTANINGWAELDFIPMRVYVTSGPAASQTITVDFPHTKSEGSHTLQGVENLYSFTASPNVVITSGPTLNAPIGVDTWSYTFTINLTNNSPGAVTFYARLAAGAHLFGGSSMMIGGSPGLGSISIHKPAAVLGNPDLAIVKSGPASANPGDLISYSIQYQNKIAGAGATGVQITDFLPAEVTLVNCSGGCAGLGNTVTWDLGNLPRGAAGVITYQVAVTNEVTTGFSFQNNAGIASAENDANLADNFSSVTTVITSNCIPPSLVANPADIAMCAGDSTTLTVAANGSAPLGYQWRKDGVDISGATNNTLELDSVAVIDAGSYDVVLNNLCGTVASGSANVTVGSALVTTQPVDDSECVGGSSAFSVTATGDALTYQWRKDGVAIDGATNSLFTIDSVSGTDAGGYDVLIGSTCGSTTSMVANLIINAPALVTTDPADTAICAGGTANLSVSVLGSAPLTYQWRQNGVAIDGATNATYAAADAGDYDVIVAGSCSSAATSAVGSVTVNVAPAIAQDPTGATLCAGDPLNLSVAATGTSVTYQWRRSGVNIDGATTAAYSVATVSASDADAYDVVVSGVCGTPVTSAVAVVAVNVAPAITQDPAGLSLCAGGPVSLTVAATGTSPTYQWRKGGVNIDGATSAAYSIAAVSASDADSYDVVVSGVCGTPATSAAAVVTVKSVPVSADDNYGTLENTALTAAAPGVLGNDSVASGDPFTAALVTSPSNGSLALNADGSFNYTPNANFHGSDSFTYTAQDDCGASLAATVVINVTAVNHSPVAVDDSVTIAENSGAHVVAVLANDSDPDGDSLTVSSVTSASHGTAVIAGGGANVSYTPGTGFAGSDSFTYTISDGQGGFATATVNVTVTATPVIPVANNDSYQLTENSTLTIATPGVLANDTVTGNGTLSAVLLSNPAHGTVSLNADGSFTYVPAEDFNGVDTFTYRAVAGAQQSSAATVTITALALSEANDADLYVRTVRARVNWTALNRDTLTLAGRINPRGINDDLAGATIALDVNGTSLLSAMTLDARGNYSGMIGSAKIKCHLKTNNGTYTIRITGADLRTVLGLTNTTGRAMTDLAVRLTITGVGLGMPVLDAELESPYKTVANKGTGLSFNFRKNRTLTGVFNCNTTVAAQNKNGGQVASSRGVIVTVGGDPVVPTGDITIQVGNASTTVPFAMLTVKGSGAASTYTYVAPRGTVSGVTRFSLRNVTHSFLLSISTPDIGLPGAGNKKHDLPVQIQVPTADGTMLFDSMIELERTTSNTTHWKR